jgi:hypothetical protein
MRSRNIKPGFYKSEQLISCSRDARLFFPGLWMLADRGGKLEDRPIQIKIELFPCDDLDINALLKELSGANLITRYELDGKKYIKVNGFCKHQNPHYRERESEIPDPPETKAEQAQDKPQASPGLAEKRHGLAVLIPDSGFLIPDSKEQGQDETSEPIPRGFEVVETEYRDSLIQICKKLDTGNGFNPYQFVLGMKKNGLRSDAVLFSLKQLERAGDDVKSPWPFAETIAKSESMNKNEQDAIREHEQMKKNDPLPALFHPEAKKLK